MSFITYNLLAIFDVEALIRYGGLLLVCLIVFGTTGLFFCFFIPTGAFIFTAGLYTATGDIPYNIYAVCSLLIVTSMLGNITGYWFGMKAGPLLYKREDSRFFKKQHLTTAKSFYEKYGWLAITMGLFLPGKIPALKPWLNYVVIGFIILVTIPLIIWVRKELKRLQKVNNKNISS